jgi:hypothetical protein
VLGVLQVLVVPEKKWYGVPTHFLFVFIIITMPCDFNIYQYFSISINMKMVDNVLMPIGTGRYEAIGAAGRAALRRAEE